MNSKLIFLCVKMIRKIQTYSVLEYDIKHIVFKMIYIYYFKNVKELAKTLYKLFRLRPSKSNPV